MPLEYIRGRLRENMNAENIPFALVAHDDATFLGTASVIASDLEDLPQYTPWVAAVWVEPKQRKRRVGRALVPRRNDAFALGIERAYLCAPKNAAISIFGRAGCRSWKKWALAASPCSAWTGRDECLGRAATVFRPLETRDVEAISLVHHRACLIAYRFIDWRYSLEEVERWYSKKFAEWTWTLAAFDGDAAMAGFIALKDHHIDQLYVDPSRQRCGVGSALLGEAVAAAPGRITLDVFEENISARAFYEKHGFQPRDRWMNEEEGAIDLLYVRE